MLTGFAEGAEAIRAILGFARTLYDYHARAEGAAGAGEDGGRQPRSPFSVSSAAASCTGHVAVEGVLLCGAVDRHR